MREDGAEEEPPGALLLFGCRHIGKDLPLPEEVGEDPAHADVVVPDSLIGEREVAFRGEPPPMPGGPAPSACRLRRKVIDDGVAPGIADDVQVGISVHDAQQVLLGIPAVAEDYDAPLCGEAGHGLPHHGSRQLQLGLLLPPHAVAKGDCQVRDLAPPPYRDAEHEADEAVPIEVAAAVMRGMVEEL